MASQIITRTINSATETAVQMSNATWARSITLPSNWNQIRVGMRYHLYNSGANLTGGCQFAMGFNSGTTNQFGDATTQNFCGMIIGDNSTDWTYNTGGYGYQIGHYYSGMPLYAATKVGSIVTETKLIDSPMLAVQADANTSVQDIDIILCDVTKGSPNYTIAVNGMHVNLLSYGEADWTSTAFLSMMASATPTFTSGFDQGTTPLYSTNLNTTLAVDEGTNGTLNAINLSWNRADALWEVCDVAVAVLA